MTTLFNLFCPLILNLSNVSKSVILMVLWMSAVGVALSLGMFFSMTHQMKTSLTNAMFPGSGASKHLMFSGIIMLSVLNLTSLIAFSYPVTTTLGFNLASALSLWLISITLHLVKPLNASSLLPSNAPWYLVPFLCLIELISISVRPITLCFRLLANMSAGHILLTLFCKLPSLTWISGALFGLLELMVSMVQAFVFLMLVSVYLEEVFSH